jgi:hypothetical protein
MAFTPFGSSFPMVRLRASLSQDYEDKRESTQVQKQSRVPDIYHLRGCASDLSLKPWLYCVATNLAGSHLRHEQLIRWFPWMEHGKDGVLEHLNVAGPEEQKASGCLSESY